MKTILKFDAATSQSEAHSATEETDSGKAQEEAQTQGRARTMDGTTRWPTKQHAELVTARDSTGMTPLHVAAGRYTCSHSVPS